MKKPAPLTISIPDDGKKVVRLVDKDGAIIDDRHVGGKVSPELVAALAEEVAKTILAKGLKHHFILAVYDPTGESNIAWASPTHKPFIPAVLGALRHYVETELRLEGKRAEEPTTASLLKPGRFADLATDAEKH